MNYLGIDWGKSKIGLALGSDLTKIASPIMVLSFNSYKEVIDKIKELIVQEDIKKLIVGKPVSLGGGENLTKDFNKFTQLLDEIEGVEIAYEDERLSTKLAGRLNKDFKGYKKLQDDDLAATAILQTYLDRL